MRCPKCGCTKSAVVDTRDSRDGTAIRRRRQCEECGARFRTYEEVYTGKLYVIKRGGFRQEFNRSKLVGGIARACEKRPVPLSAINEIVDSVVAMIKESPKQAIKTATIGELVMERLAKLDQVAYVRFASVYRCFEGAEDFASAAVKVSAPRRRGRPRKTIL